MMKIKVRLFLYWPEKRHTLDWALKASEWYEWKGLSYLFNAVKLLKDEIPSLKLEIVGSGNSEAHFKNLSKSLGIEENVRFAGRKANEEIGRYYKHSKIVVLPSYSGEAFPVVCLEACFFGKPIVATNLGGIPELINDGVNGYLVEPKDTGQLSKAIKELLSSPEKRKLFGNESRRIMSENFKYADFILKHEDLLNKLTRK